MSKDHRKAVAQLTKRLKQELGDSIDAIVLYGSVARGEATDESDLDILLLCSDPVGLRRRLEPVLDAIDRNRALISPVCMTSEGLERRLELGEYFACDVLREGIVLYDSGAFEAIKKRWKGKMRQPNRELILIYLQRADQSLSEARLLLGAEGTAAAVDRAYYAVHYAAQAILMSLPVRPPRTHHGLITVFTQEVVDKGIIGREFRGQLGRLFELRQEAVYYVMKDVSRQPVEEAIQMAEAFVNAIKTVLDFS